MGKVSMSMYVYSLQTYEIAFKKKKKRNWFQKEITALHINFFFFFSIRNVLPHTRGVQHMIINGKMIEDMSKKQRKGLAHSPHMGDYMGVIDHGLNRNRWDKTRIPYTLLTSQDYESLA